MCDMSEDSNMTIGHGGIFFKKDLIFEQLTYMFDKIAPEVIRNICEQEDWQEDACVDQIIKCIETEEQKETELSADNRWKQDTVKDLSHTYNEIAVESTLNEPKMQLGAIPKSTNNIGYGNGNDNTEHQLSSTIPYNISRNLVLDFSSILSQGPNSFTDNHNTNSSGNNQRKLDTMNNPKVDIAIDNINKGYKVMILLRGAPGSGKSTIARYIVDQTVKEDYRNFIFSTDDYFYNVNDQYVYQPDRLSDAHDFNHRRCRQKAAAGWSPIIIDNTNMKIWEMSPYVHTATQYNYMLEIIEPKNSWYRSAGKLAMKNRHSVPKEKIQRMLDQYEKINVPRLLQINNISSKPNVPQFRHNPPLPLNVRRPDSPKEKIDINISASVENLKKPLVFEVHKNPYNLNLDNIIKREEGAKPIIINVSKPQRESPRRTAKSTSPSTLVNLEETADLLIKLESKDNEWTRYEEESNNFWHPANDLIETMVSIPKPQRQISTSTATSDTSNNSKPEIVDNKIYSILKDRPKHEAQLTGDLATIPVFIPRLQKHKLGCANESKSFQLLRQIYPNKLAVDLWDLFEKCNFDVDWAIEILLKDNSYGDQLYDSSTKSNETFNCNCDNNNDDAISLNTVDIEKQQNIDVDIKDNSVICDNINEISNSIKQQQTQKSKKDKAQNMTTDMLATKQMIEKQFIINDEHYSDHVRKIRNLLHPNETTNTNITAAATTATTTNTANNQSALNITEDIVADDSPDNLITFDSESKDNDEDISSESENNELLEINLGLELATQLHGIFGVESSSDHLTDDYKTNVFIPRSIAKQLYALWMESIHNQVEEQRQAIMKEDADFARLLETHGAHSKSSQLPKNYKEILDMELAWNIYKTENADWKESAPPDLASHLTRLKLYESFPDVDKETLLEILMAHENKYSDTVDVLNDSLNKNIADKMQSKGIELMEEVKKEIAKGSTNDEFNTDEAFEPIKERKLTPDEAKRAAIREFEECRNMAVHHRQMKAECHKKAQDAIQGSNTAIAVYYSKIANLHQTKIDVYNQKAANCIMEVHDLTQNNPDIIDLHYLHIREAIECLDIFLDKHISKMRTVSRYYKHIFIITGRGLHSSGGVATIKNHVKSRLKDRNLKWLEVNPGLLRVKIFAASKYSKNC